MYCENLEFSLTDQQLPMFLRLLYLCVALQNRGTFTDKDNSETSVENSDAKINISEETSGRFFVDSYVLLKHSLIFNNFFSAYMYALPIIYRIKSMFIMDNGNC